MSDTQVRAALGLLRKTLPDLAVTQVQGENGGPLAVDFRWLDSRLNQQHILEGHAEASDANGQETPLLQPMELADDDGNVEVVFGNGEDKC